MKEKHITKSRREFIKAGFRTILLGSLAFVGLSLGRRGLSGWGEKTSCAVDLPCRICSKLPGCQKQVARDTKQEYRNSLDQSAMKGVRKWTFHPGKRGGEAVEMWVKVPIRFRLK